MLRRAATGAAFAFYAAAIYAQLLPDAVMLLLFFSALVAVFLYNDRTMLRRHTLLLITMLLVCFFVPSAALLSLVIGLLTLSLLTGELQALLRQLAAIPHLYREMLGAPLALR
jgi:hypothetical protein